MPNLTPGYALMIGVVDGEDTYPADEYNKLVGTLNTFLLRLAALVGAGCWSSGDFALAQDGSNLVVGPGTCFTGTEYLTLTYCAAPQNLSLAGASDGAYRVFIRPDGQAQLVGSENVPEFGARLVAACTLAQGVVGSIDPLPAGRVNLESLLAVRVNSADPAGGYLQDKVAAGAGIRVDVQGGQLVIVNTALGERVKVDDTDTAGYLAAKLVAGEGIALTVGGEAGARRITISAAGGEELPTLTEVSEAVDVALLPGESVELIWDHGEDAIFTEPLYLHAYAQVGGVAATDIKITPLLQGRSGSTDGSRVLVRVERLEDY